MASLIDISVEGVNLDIVKILRLLRTLRPLRFISHNIGMKLVVTALLESVAGIINVVCVVLLIWMMFGIFGVSMLKNKMHYCDLPPDFPLTMYEVNECTCIKLGFDWKNRD